MADKICDQVSDAVLDACLKADPSAKVACETAAKTGMILVFGEITTSAILDFQKIVRGVIKVRGAAGCSVELTAQPAAHRLRRLGKGF